MSVYRIKNDFENFFTFTVKNAELGLKMPNYSPKFLAKSRIGDWVKPNASFYASANYQSEKVLIPDLTTWNAGLLVLNTKSYGLLKEVLSLSGEFLEVSVEGIEYFIFNTLKTIDEDKQDYSNAMEDPNLYGSKLGVKIDESAFDGVHILKTSIDNCLHMYCTDSFKKLVKEKGLMGLEFQDYEHL